MVRNAGVARHDERDRGGMAVLTGSVVAVMMAVIVTVIASLGGDLVERQRAQNAADAAALAGCVGGPAAARRAAELNDAELVGIVIDGSTADVVVTYGDQTARARATSQP